MEPLPPVAILAGGLGSRLGELTSIVPKSLVRVGGKPFVRHQLQLLRRAGISRVVLCVGHLGHMIVAEIGDGGGCGLDIAYSFDGKELLGTAGALARALPLLGQEFYVLYGDSFLVDIDYRAAYEHFRRSDRLALMTVYRNRGRWELSNVHLRDGEIIRYDKRHPSSKMEHVDFGLGLLRKEALDGVPSGVVYDLGDLYHDLVARQQMAALEVGSRFYEVGSLAGLDEVRNYLEAGLGEADGLLY